MYPLELTLRMQRPTESFVELMCDLPKESFIPPMCYNLVLIVSCRSVYNVGRYAHAYTYSRICVLEYNPMRTIYSYSILFISNKLNSYRITRISNKLNSYRITRISNKLNSYSITYIFNKLPS